MIRLFALVLISAIFAKPAYAYIDAALGSLVLQSVIAGFFTFLVFCRSWIHKVKSFFGKKTANANPSEQAE